MSDIPNQFDATTLSAEELIKLLDSALLGDNEEECLKAVELLKKRIREVRAAQLKAKGGPYHQN